MHKNSLNEIQYQTTNQPTWMFTGQTLFSQPKTKMLLLCLLQFICKHKIKPHRYKIGGGDNTSGGWRCNDYSIRMAWKRG